MKKQSMADTSGLQGARLLFLKIVPVLTGRLLMVWHRSRAKLQPDLLRFERFC
jgi:hypothetical protein|tara:strand:- start:346 stop:504 length:159 start_codon:yes stop_codon:yes gene_type:complete